MNVLSEFARKTGDRAVLSKTDIEILALAYEVECERNGGDWRLRSVPGQKRVNGKPPVKEEEPKKEEESKEEEGEKKDESQAVESKEEGKGEGADVEAITESLKTTTIENGDAVPTSENEGAASAEGESAKADPAISQEPEVEDEEGSDSDSGGWITPSNLKKRQARDEAISASSVPEPKVMQVATITTDFAVSFSERKKKKISLTTADPFQVPKRPPPNEPQPSLNNNHAENPTPEILHQTLPRLFLHHQGHDKAVLPALRKRYPHARLMHHGRKRPVQNAPEEEHAVE